MRAEQEALVSVLKSEDEAAKREAEQKYDAIDRAVADQAAAFMDGNMENALTGVLFYTFRYDLSEEKQNQLVSSLYRVFLRLWNVWKT